MSTAYGKIRKVGGVGWATAMVEVVPSSTFQVKCDLLAPVQVQDLEGHPFPAQEIEITCMTGATYARHVVPLSRSRVILRAAQGTVAPRDIQAFAIATTLAIARALAAEDSIPAQVFQGDFASWQACPDDRQSAAK